MTWLLKMMDPAYKKLTFVTAVRRLGRSLLENSDVATGTTTDMVARILVTTYRTPIFTWVLMVQIARVVHVRGTRRQCVETENVVLMRVTHLAQMIVTQLKDAWIVLHSTTTRQLMLMMVAVRFRTHAPMMRAHVALLT